MEKETELQSMDCCVKHLNDENLFSIMIPTWNNLDFLKLCIRSIQKNSTYNHEILIHVNEGNDGTLEWVKKQGFKFSYTPENVGVCYALNSLRPIVTTNYILYMNDDMYVCPGWDEALYKEIIKIGHKKFFLSATLIQPRKFFCKSVISPANYGESVEDFDEQGLLNEYSTYEHYDWLGSTWPPNIVHKDIWDLVGGYSIEYSPGMYSDPDFSAKLYHAGVRIFKGINNSRVYHFESRSTKRVSKNNGSLQFLRKWGITSASFMRDVLHRGEPIGSETSKRQLKVDVLRSKIKQAITIFNSTKSRRIW